MKNRLLFRSALMLAAAGAGLALLATGCGSDDKGRPNASAPVNNIEDNINNYKQMDSDLKKIKADHEKAVDEALKKPGAEPSR